MADLPQPWRAYACLQDELSSSTKVDPFTWGVEAGLDHLVFRNQVDGTPNIAKARATGTRRERSRTRWRALRLAPIVTRETAPEAHLLARSDLRAVGSRISASEWALLFGLAEGEAYAELAQRGGPSAAALRVSATRLRAKLRAVLAGSTPDRVHPVPDPQR